MNTRQDQSPSFGSFITGQYIPTSSASSAVGGRMNHCCGFTFFLFLQHG